MQSASDSPLPDYVQAQQGHRRRTHRGRRSRGKGAKPQVDHTDHMAQANAHIRNAHADPTAKGTTAHLFKALSSLKKAQ
jgi:hypothetical protein